MVILRTPEYAKRASKLLPADMQILMESAIASAPESHPVVAGSGGLRKARWARPGTGKSGGVRTLYYYHVDPATVLFIAIDTKNEQENFSHADKIRFAKAIKAFKDAQDNRRRA